MKVIKWEFIVIIALLLLLVGSIIFWPSPQPSEIEKGLNQRTETLKAMAEELVKQQETVLAMLAKDSVEDLRALKRFEIENKRLRVRIANIKPRVDSILIANPSVDSLVRAQDSLIIVQASRIDSLSLEKMIMAKSYTFLVASKDQQIQALKGVNENLNAMAEIKNKDMRRARRQNKLLKIALPVAVVGVLFLVN